MYPDIQPFEKGTLQVSKIHTIYYELSGKQDGNPVVFVHGGPGAGAGENDRRWFNPEKYKIVIFDQRGSGRSTPLASTDENTTQDLIADMEKLRERLKIDKWHVFGGSWGSTLSLAYSQAHSSRVKSLILRGIFTGRKRELDFTFKPWGVANMFPEAWEEFIAPIPEEERHDLLHAYYIRFSSPDADVRMSSAKIWTKYETYTSSLRVDPKKLEEAEQDDFAISVAKIEAHYFVNGCFLRDGQLFEQGEIDKIRHIPTVVVQGRYDVVCPPSTAYELRTVFPECEFHFVPDAGHSSREPGTQKLLIAATDRFADL